MKPSRLPSCCRAEAQYSIIITLLLLVILVGGSLWMFSSKKNGTTQPVQPGGDNNTPAAHNNQPGPSRTPATPLPPAAPFGQRELPANANHIPANAQWVLSFQPGSLISKTGAATRKLMELVTSEPGAPAKALWEIHDQPEKLGLKLDQPIHVFQLPTPKDAHGTMIGFVASVQSAAALETGMKNLLGNDWRHISEELKDHGTFKGMAESDGAVGYNDTLVAGIFFERDWRYEDGGGDSGGFSVPEPADGEDSIDVDGIRESPPQPDGSGDDPGEDAPPPAIDAPKAPPSPRRINEPDFDPRPIPAPERSGPPFGNTVEEGPPGHSHEAHRMPRMDLGKHLREIFDGKNPLPANNSSFATHLKTDGDVGGWIDVGALLGASENSYTGSLTMRFDTGRIVAKGGLSYDKTLLGDWGGSGLNKDLLDAVPNDSLLVLSQSMNMDVLRKYIAKVLSSADIDALDEFTKENLGVSSKVLMDAFGGDMVVAFTGLRPHPRRGMRDPQPEFMLGATLGDPVAATRLLGGILQSGALGELQEEGIEMVRRNKAVFLAPRGLAQTLKKGAATDPLSGKARSILAENDMGVVANWSQLFELMLMSGAPRELLMMSYQMNGITLRGDAAPGQQSLELELALRDTSKNSLRKIFELVAMGADQLLGGGISYDTEEAYPPDMATETDSSDSRGNSGPTDSPDFGPSDILDAPLEIEEKKGPPPATTPKRLPKRPFPDDLKKIERRKF